MWESDSDGACKRPSYALRMALLGGVSLISFGIVLGRVPAAFAEQVIATSTASTVNSDGTGILVNPDVDLTGSPGISNSTLTGTIYSQGTIESGSFGLENFSTIGTLTNTAGGTIAGHSNGVYNTAGSIGTLANSGLLFGNGLNARGVQNQGGTITLLTNSGTITGSSGIAAQSGIGSIINQNGGTISSAGPDYGIYVNAPVQLLENQAGGTISAGTGTAVLVQSHALSTLTNSGLITGGNGVGNLSGTIGTLGNTGTIFGTLEGMYNDATIGTLTNSGTITGGNDGVNNAGTIGAVANQTGGTISAVNNSSSIGGGLTAISNAGAIGTLGNSGTISGTTYGIENTITGSIGTLTNSGTISAGGGNNNRLDAISNGGTINTIINTQTGTIIGANTGISYFGGIGTLNNSGLISGTNFQGIDAEGTAGELDNTATGTIIGENEGIGAGTIGTIINAGTISGGYYGIYVFGSIGTLANSGDINSSRFYTGVDVESGTIGALTNTGTISGFLYGASNGRSIGTLSNSGTITGTTAGFINYASITALLNETTGTLAGSITGSIGVLSVDDGNSPGTIGLLKNGLAGASITADTIFGSITGVSNQADIGTLANNGTISGGKFGVANSYHTKYVDGAFHALALTTSETQASIATLSNTGSIIGGSTGVYNDGGYIGTVSNSGTIYGPGAGIYNNGGTIGTITNTASGTIYADILNSGIKNNGVVGDIGNSGMISGFAGVYNSSANLTAGTIGTLTNSGSITGLGYGVISDNATIGTLTNKSGGLISGVSETGIENLFGGYIKTLTNSGSISGAHDGIANHDFIGTLTQSGGGTITGGSIGVLNNGGATFTALANGPAGASITADTIFGSITGVSNDGAFINSLANNGSIHGGTYGIANSVFTRQAPAVLRGIAAAQTNNRIQGSIATLANTGSISGGTTGVYNAGGYIGTLSNSGTITGTAKIGVANIDGGTISTLTNLAGGAIIGSANASGIFNSSEITLLSNSGTVSANLGIVNHSSSSSSIAYIGTLTNAGTISGASEGVVNYNGTIATLSNSGSIINGRSGIVDFGGGVILTLSNSGTVTGTEVGIRDQGAVGTIVNTSIVSGGSTGMLVASVALTSLANSGTISGSIGVNNNNATIGIFSQSGGGTIYGGTDGVYNNQFATIGQLTNGRATPITADTIFGSITGISNDGGYIGHLSNNGTIAGGSYGIANSLYQYSFSEVERPILSVLTENQTQGSIATLTNSGSIYGGQIGIYNDGGYIGTLTNNAGGTIGGGATAIDNYFSATIATLTNSGTIFGTITGINNSDTSSTIGTIINQGTGLIYGGAVALNAGDGTVIKNAGLITSGNILLQPALELGNSDIVTNSGTISGGGLFYAGVGSTVTNSGTIADPGGDAVDFYNDGTNYLTLTTGTDIVGTIYGNASSGRITLDGTGNLTAPIADFGDGSALNIDSNGDWTASGTWDIASVTNDGRFAPGETADGGVGSNLYLTGNFTQNADGTLLVAVAPEEEAFTTSDFVITGNASLSGAVAFTFAPGTYEAGSHSFLSATDVTGTFTTQHYNDTPSGLTASVTYPDETDPVLVLAGSGTGIVNVGPTTTSTITTTTPPTTTPPATTPPTPPAFVVRPPDTGIFADELQSSANLAQASNAALLGKAAEGGAAASAVCGAEAGVTPAQTTPDKITGVEKLTNAVADAFCGAGGWIQASGTAMDVEGDGDTPGYNADTAGFLAGIDAPVGKAGTRLGLAVGYDETFLADSSRGKGQVDTFRAGIFGSQALGPFMLAGDFLYGHTSTNSQRVTGIGYANSTADGNIYSGALQADTLVRLGTLNLVPQAGLRIAGVSAGSFAESGVLPAFALTGNSGFYTSVQPFVNLDVSTVFLTSSNIVITPDASFGYAYEAGDIGRAVIVTAHDGTHFSSDYLKLDPNMGELSAGISAGKDWWSFYARYSAAVTGNWTSQTGEAGLRIRF